MTDEIKTGFSSFCMKKEFGNILPMLRLEIKGELRDWKFFCLLELLDPKLFVFNFTKELASAGAISDYFITSFFFSNSRAQML